MALIFLDSCNIHCAKDNTGLSLEEQSDIDKLCDRNIKNTITKGNLGLNGSVDKDLKMIKTLIKYEPSLFHTDITH